MLDIELIKSDFEEKLNLSKIPTKNHFNFVCISAGLSQTGTYVDSSSNTKAELDLRRAVEIYVKNDIDVIICEVINIQ